MDNGNYIGIDIGGTSAKIGLVNSNGEIIKKTSVSTIKATQAEDILTEYFKPVRDWINTDESIKAIGIVFPGFYDHNKELTCNSENIPVLRNFPIVKHFTEEFKLPVFADNDATAAAVGEHRFGIGKNFKNFLLMTIGTGIGGGLVLNNKIYRGTNGFAGEIGHVIVVSEGRDCSCGNKGCIEAYASASAMIRSIQDGIKKGFIKNYPNPGEINAKFIFQKAQANDPYCLQVVDSAARHLGDLLGSINNILNLEAVIIGGGVASAGMFFLEKIKYYTSQISWNLLAKNLQILQALLLNDAGIIGAASMAMEELSAKTCPD